MNYTEVKNLLWVNEAQTAMVCDVTFEHIGTVPFSPNPYDVETHSVEIWNRAIAGDFGPIADWVEPPAPPYTVPQIPVAVPNVEGSVL